MPPFLRILVLSSLALLQAASLGAQTVAAAPVPADQAEMRGDNNSRLADTEAIIFPGLMVDQLHLSLHGYQVRADGLKPILTELLGLPASVDHAPPPTGDPSAQPKVT